MKGIAHFSLGVAAATFIPGVMESAVSAHSFDLLVAGAFGLLPDTLDFKFARFFEKEDIVIDPDPNNLDPQAMADKIADAIEQANQNGKEIRVKFHTMQLAPDRWRKYDIGFDTEKSEVFVGIGPIVSTSQQPLPGTEPPADRREGRAKVSCELIHHHDKPSRVDILSGPTIGFTPRKEGKVEVVFIPWHRQWSHSFTMGIYLGIAAFIIAGLLGGINKGLYWAALVSIPFLLHVAADCLGFMGGNLFWPFTKERIGGLKFFHASAPLANFFAVWLSGLIVLFNANKVATEPIFQLGPLAFFGIWLGIPALIVWVYVKLSRRKTISEEQEQTRELMEEIADGSALASARSWEDTGKLS